MNTERNDSGFSVPLEYYEASYCHLKCPSLTPMEIVKTVEVLILGEDLDVSQAMGAILQDQGYQIYLAPDVKTAVEELDNYNFDLVIVQVGRDSLDGLAAVRKAKQMGSPPKIMLISGTQVKLFPVEAFESDADDYLVFPFSTIEFGRRVAALLGPELADRQIQDQSPAEKINAQALVTLNQLMEEIRKALLQASASLQGFHGREFAHLSIDGAKKLDEVMDHLSQAVGLAWHFHHKTSHISQMNGW